MKILIRHPLTRLYRKKDGSWTHQPDDAETFEGTAEAVKVCISERLDAYEILVKHSLDSRYDILLVKCVSENWDGHAPSHGPDHNGATNQRHKAS